VADARAKGYDVTEDDSGVGPDHVYIADPFGNRLELIQAG